jgi:hypothetical protein
MAVDTKPNLSDSKFEQLSGETLHLSGCTIIHNYGEFTLDSGATLSILTNPGSGKVLTSDSQGVATWQNITLSSGENITKEITQSSHGFVAGDIIGFSGGTYNKAIADGTYDGEVIGVVSCCVNINTFCVTQAGFITGLTGLQTSCTYFLSDLTDGLMTAIAPTGDSHVSKSVFIATSSSSGYVLPYPGYIITTGSTGGSLSACNGLTDDAVSVCLGGLLCNNTIIDGNSGAYDLSITNLDSFNLGFDNVSTITDGGTNGGLRYADNYCGNYVARSIPDVAYVTGQTAAVCLGWSNLTNGSTVAGCGTPASATTICNNSFYGVEAGKNIGIGCNNVAIGTMALNDTTIGNCNTGVGTEVLYNNISGNHNTALGYRALYSDETGCGNVAIGYLAGQNETGSNKLYIANNATLPLVYGDFTAQCLVINGQLKITGVTNGACTDSILVWSTGGLVKKVPYVSGDTSITITGATNGLSVNGTNQVVLGGTLCETTTILGAGQDLTIGTCDGGASPLTNICMWSSGSTCIGNITANGCAVFLATNELISIDSQIGTMCSQVGLNANNLSLGAVSGATCTIIDMCNDYIRIEGTSGFRGVEYYDDYSLNYTCLSLVNAGYVTGLTASLGKCCSLLITGNSSNTGFTVNHALNKQFVMVQVIQAASPYATVYTDVQRVNANCVCVLFDTAPATGTNYCVIIIG